MESGDPFRLIDLLTKHNVEFVIIGGHAVTFHGYVRATEDTDVVIRRSAENEQALFGALTEAHAQWIGNKIDPATGLERTFPVSLDYIRSSHLMMLFTDFGFLDVFDYIPGYPSTSVDELFQTAVPNLDRQFPSLEWIRKMKQASGRLKDQLDLEHLPPEAD